MLDKDQQDRDGDKQCAQQKDQIDCAVDGTPSWEPGYHGVIRYMRRNPSIALIIHQESIHSHNILMQASLTRSTRLDNPWMLHAKEEGWLHKKKVQRLAKRHPECLDDQTFMNGEWGISHWSCLKDYQVIGLKAEKF
ncbi:hypothetical protein ACA910_003795 [Epithemia clementina (nom. ined.)]